MMGSRSDRSMLFPAIHRKSGPRGTLHGSTRIPIGRPVAAYRGPNARENPAGPKPGGIHKLTCSRS
jgi:hypothetical protein